MKKYLLIFIEIFCVFITNAQFIEPSGIETNRFTVLDSAQLKFTYSFTYKKNYSLNDADPVFVVDKQSLLLGKNTSKYYSQNYLDYCEKWTKNMSCRMEVGNCSFEIFKNYPANNETVTEQAGKVFGGSYIYNENLNDFTWKISNDTIPILGYTCQKATTTFRGRNYTAWFTPDIPSNNGPWKFGGLPGLILKISDDKRNFTFECSGILQLEKPELIKLFTLNYKKVTRQELDKVYRRFVNNPKQFWITTGVEVGEAFMMELPKMIYNPIELE